MTPLPSIDDTAALLGAHDYVADRQLATALFLALSLQRPLFLEGEAGVGKTEIAKALAATLGRRADPPAVLRGARRRRGAVYEWNYAAPDARDPPRRGRPGDGVDAATQLDARPLHRALPDAARRCCRRSSPRRRGRRCC